MCELDTFCSHRSRPTHRLKKITEIIRCFIAEAKKIFSYNLKIKIYNSKCYQLIRIEIARKPMFLNNALVTHFYKKYVL